MNGAASVSCPFSAPLRTHARSRMLASRSRRRVILHDQRGPVIAVLKTRQRRRASPSPSADRKLRCMGNGAIDASRIKAVPLLRRENTSQQCRKLSYGSPVAKSRAADVPHVIRTRSRPSGAEESGAAGDYGMTMQIFVRASRRRDSSPCPQ